MTTLKTRKIFALLALLTVATIATDAAALEQEGGIRFVVGEPTGTFGEAAEDPGFGLALHYGLRPQPALTFGVGLDILIYGHETRKIRLPLVEDFDLTTTNNLAGGFLFTQFRPFRGAVQPYAEARLGMHYLWTESKLEDEDWWDDDDIARETNYDDFANYWGLGGGLVVRLGEGDRYERKPGVYLDFKVVYLQGGEAEYLTEGDITIVNNRPILNPSRSETDLTTYELGVILTF